MTSTAPPLLPAERPSFYDGWRARLAAEPRLQRLYGWLAPLLITLLAAILRDAIGRAYLPEGDISELAALVHGSLTAAADRGQNSDQDRAAREQAERPQHRDRAPHRGERRRARQHRPVLTGMKPRE